MERRRSTTAAVKAITREEQRSALRTVLLWFAALAVAVISWSILSYSTAQAQTSSPLSDVEGLAIQTVIDDQIQAFRADDATRAFSHAAPNIRAIFRTEDNFMSMVKRGYGMIYDPVAYDFEALRSEGGVLIQPVVFTGDDFQPVRALYEMTQTDGVWKISGVYLEAIEDQMT